MEENLLIWFSSWKSSGCAHNKTSIVCITIHICLLITFFIGWHMSPLFKKTFILFILQLCVERDFNRSTIEIFISIILAYMIKPQWVKHWIVFNVIMNLRGKTNNIYIYIFTFDQGQVMLCLTRFVYQITRVTYTMLLCIILSLPSLKSPFLILFDSPLVHELVRKTSDIKNGVLWC